MSHFHKAQARTYSVLTHARKARGDRLEAELARLVQARLQAVQLEQQARDAETAAARTLREFTLQMQGKIAAGESTSVDAVVRARLRREALLAQLDEAAASVGRAHEEVLGCTRSCDDARQRLAVNQVQVESLAGLRDQAHQTVARMADDAEEEENSEIHAGRHFAARSAA